MDIGTGTVESLVNKHIGQISAYLVWNIATFGEDDIISIIYLRKEGVKNEHGRISIGKHWDSKL